MKLLNDPHGQFAYIHSQRFKLQSLLATIPPGWSLKIHACLPASLTYPQSSIRGVVNLSAVGANTPTLCWDFFFIYALTMNSSLKLNIGHFQPLRIVRQLSGNWQRLVRYKNLLKRMIALRYCN